MKIYLVRYSATKDDFMGLWFINGKFFCHTVEDEPREDKVPGETCIPDGTYEIDLVKYGRFHELNQSIFGFTDGAIRIKDVPNFTGIRVHWGTDESDTEGCPIVGFQAFSNWNGKGKVYGSRDAYRALYPQIRDTLATGETIKIEVTTDISNYLP